MGGAIALAFAPAARITGRPYHTVSQSEDGFERIMQSVTLDIEWTIEPPSTVIELRLAVEADTDGPKPSVTY